MASSATVRIKTRSSTGCLTCRRRHVKCDEQRPTCLKCSRLGLDCGYIAALTRSQKRQQGSPEAKRQTPRPLAQGPIRLPDQVQDSPGGQLISTQVTAWPPQDPDPCLFDVGADLGFMPDLFTSKPGFFNAVPLMPFVPLSPTVDMQLDSVGLLACLPTLVPPTSAEREGLDYYRSYRYFAFGNKCPEWSTYSIIWDTARTSPVALHLLFAAAQSEIAWRSGARPELLNAAENNYHLGRQQLDIVIASGEVEPLVIIMSFWFSYWHIHHCRPSTQQRLLTHELSQRTAEYIHDYRLQHTLTAMEEEDTGWSAAKKAVVSRLIIWLCWVDTWARSLGDGGSMAKLLTQAESRSAMADLYQMSKQTLTLNWAEYPVEQLQDDMDNSQPLDIVHETLMVVQMINDAAEQSLPLIPEASKELLLHIKRLGNRFAVRSLIRLTESTPAVRDRMLQNADWAVASYYALCIYHFRCSLTVEDQAFASPNSISVSTTAGSLMMLLLKSLANDGVGQLDRLHWPLFWAGVETTGQFKQSFILLYLKDQGLSQALRQIFKMQETGVRLGMVEIRHVLQTACAGMLNVGMGV